MNYDPPDLRRFRSRVPRDLAVICGKAMAKGRDHRYQQISEFTEDIRRHLNDEPITAKPPTPWQRAAKWVRRHAVLSTVATAAIVFLVVFSGYVLLWSNPRLKRERNRAEDQRRIAEEQTEVAEDQARIAQQRAREIQRNLNQILRLSDAKRLADLETDAEALWPAYPENISGLQEWLSRADALRGRLDMHRTTLASLRENALPNGEAKRRTFVFEDTETQWQHNLLAGLVSGLEALSNKDSGLHANIGERLDFATTIEKKSIEVYQDMWDEAIASIADEQACPQYNGLVIKPQIGLVPIGRDPDSGLWEFAHLQTGEIPLRDTEGKLFPEEKMGLVFVLIPGGSFMMGAVKPSEKNPTGAPNVDPEAEADEAPVHKVTLNPFFISKYEMTQGQWLRFTKRNPCSYGPGSELGGKRTNLLHPVERVSWEECEKVLSKLNLRLPSESEWGYGCRAGTDTVFFTGDDKKTLQDAANLVDHFCMNHGGPAGWPYEAWLDDGYTAHAPVGSYAANAFGLHDVHGNVWEWCQDIFAGYANTPVDGTPNEQGSSDRVNRGGSWSHGVFNCRSSRRGGIDPGHRNHDLGLRPALSLQL